MAFGASSSWWRSSRTACAIAFPIRRTSTPAEAPYFIMAPGTISYPSHSCTTFTGPIATLTKASSSKVSESAKATPEHIQVATAAAERVFIAPAPLSSGPLGGLVSTRETHPTTCSRVSHDGHFFFFSERLLGTVGPFFCYRQKKPRP